jgi:dTDP-4-dehydrorhamnose 3,5-epimerase
MVMTQPTRGERRIPERFTPGGVAGVIWKPLQRYSDARGWLVELFRHDDLPAEYHPAMAYVSVTQPGIARGPHEHWDQADYFCFLGPSDFKMYAWDIRVDSPSYGRLQVEVVGASRPMSLVVPAGVVHAYRNVGTEPGVVFNAANRLYKGWGRTEPVDEIRHEDDPQNRFTME